MVEARVPSSFNGGGGEEGERRWMIQIKCFESGDEVGGREVAAVVGEDMGMKVGEGKH